MEYIKFYSNLKIYLFYFILIILINKIKTDKYFKAYALQSGEIILFSDEGIKMFDKELKETLILETNIITMTNPLMYISFSQFIFSIGSYLFCRCKQDIYIIPLNNYSLIKNIVQTDINYKATSLIPYEDSNKNAYLFVCYINSDNSLTILKYSVISDDNNEPIFNITQPIKYDDTTEDSLSDEISCDLMYNNLLICFVQTKSKILVGLVFDIGNNFSFLYSVKNHISNNYFSYIKSAISADKKNCIICYLILSTDNYYSCIVFNLEYKIWSNDYQFMTKLTMELYDFEVCYNNDNNEYFIYFPFESNIYYIITLDENFNIKRTDENGKKCFFKLST